ncbi:MAG: hypothetical protein HKN14_00625 [Marinicaulis sp.]|nr:hypothetical protein [Marinicaulis sp.]NNL87895.1 hypothetical protein [Marinicaulis sp.]
MPDGATARQWRGQKYQVTKQTLQDGKLIKLLADGLAEGDIISFNFYRLESGDSLKPCEMPAEKVIDFVINSISV